MSITDDHVPPIRGAEDQHYEGGRYRVLEIARHHDTGALMVVYLSLEKQTVNVRPVVGTQLDPDGWNTPEIALGRTRFVLVPGTGGTT